jgi:hypothetical protein
MALAAQLKLKGLCRGLLATYAEIPVLCVIKIVNESN